jgi:hypothetical protein
LNFKIWFSKKFAFELCFFVFFFVEITVFILYTSEFSI